MAIALVFATLCASNTAFAAPRDECITTAELQAVQQDFFRHFPDAHAFTTYADRTDFPLLTNVATGRELEQSGKPTGEKID